MICTLEYLREHFDVFNTLCFNDTLTMPRLRIGSSRRMLGSVRYRRVPATKEGKQGEILALTISAAYDLPQQELDDTILHEMIHLYILSHNERDTATHGRLFRAMMQDINTRFGRHITITHRGTPPLSLQPQLPFLVAITTLHDGTICVTRPAQTRLRQIQRQLARLTMVHNVQWYRTIDQYLATFPRAIKVKLYRADKEKLQRALANAVAIDLPSCQHK